MSNNGITSIATPTINLSLNNQALFTGKSSSGNNKKNNRNNKPITTTTNTRPSTTASLPVANKKNNGVKLTTSTNTSKLNSTELAKLLLSREQNKKNNNNNNNRRTTISRFNTPKQTPASPAGFLPNTPTTANTTTPNTAKTTNKPANNTTRRNNNNNVENNNRTPANANRTRNGNNEFKNNIANKNIQLTPNNITAPKNNSPNNTNKTTTPNNNSPKNANKNNTPKNNNITPTPENNTSKEENKSLFKKVSEVDNKILYTILYVILLVIIFICIYFIGKFLIKKYIQNKHTIRLLTGVKSADKPYVISQDPNSKSYIPIVRSEGQSGIEFSYSAWLYIDETKDDAKQHIFHKGNNKAYPIMCPAVYLEKGNNLVVYINTLSKIDEKLEIPEIPIKKWICLNIVVKNRELDVYINGYLKDRKNLTSLPKQNNGNFWCNMNGGFKGFVSKINYYPYSLELDEIIDIVESGPASTKCIATGDRPPYLNKSWFLSSS